MSSYIISDKREGTSNITNACQFNKSWLLVQEGLHKAKDNELDRN
jgi:hypothetical protein